MESFLEHLVGAYFNQDSADDYDDDAEAVCAFLTDEPGERDQLYAEITAELAKCDEDIEGHLTRSGLAIRLPAVPRS